TIRADWSVDRFPGFELLARTAVAAQHFLELAHLAHGGVHLTLRSALAWAFRDRRIKIGSEESVVIAININYLVTSEIHRVRVEGPRPAEEVGVEHLEGQGLPSARGASGEIPRIGLANDAEMFFQVGDQFGHDRVAIGAIVGGVHSI